MAELVAGIHKRDRLGARGDAVSGEDLHTLGGSERGRVESEFCGQPAVDLHQPRLGNRRRRKAREEALGQAGI